MNLIERLLPIFHRNFPWENRGIIWNQCMAQATQVPLTEANLDNMCQTALVSGFGGGGGKLELLKLAQALGVCGVSNPEADAAAKYHVDPPVNANHLTTDELLDRIQQQLPFPIRFPPFSGNCLQGLLTKYGVTSNRHLFYLWVLKRILELCPDPQSGIIEIGAGFGVLGYYLDQVGYRDYTTIDLAMINVCQAYFLAKNLPNRTLILSSEAGNPFDPQYRDAIKLLHATDFPSVPKHRFSLMVNMDGLTEMGATQAAQYAQSHCAPMLLSINHELNEFRVLDIVQPHKTLKYRYPFWLRDGYVEELYVEKPTLAVKPVAV